MIPKLVAAAAFMIAQQASAYPLVVAACKQDPIACVQSGKLEFVSIYGKIGYEDLDFFQMLDENVSPEAPFPRIELNSYGGHVDAALEIGRILRKHAAVAETGSPIIRDPAPQCSSACALIAQAAVHRRLTHVGLHSVSVREKVDENVWETLPGDNTDIEAYLLEMGANQKLIDIIRTTPFDEITEFFYDPNLPFEDQEIFALGLYSKDDQYFPAKQDAALDEENFQSSNAYMVNAASYGSIRAMRDLARHYTAYSPDIEPDFKAARDWLQKAADKGDVFSMHDLGYYYSYGVGVAQDDVKGAEFYLQAAKLGLAPSQNNIGWGYYTGVGVQKSLPDAIYWITKSAEQGEAFGYGSLCEIHGATDLFKNDPTEAFKWCGLAVHHLPEGDAKDAAKVVYDRLITTIGADDLAAANRLIQNWDEDHVTTSMRNVGDDLN